MNDWETDRLADKLTLFFIRYLQAVECPPVRIEEFNKQETLGLDKYRNDPVFYTKVQHLTACILQIVNEANQPHRRPYRLADLGKEGGKP